MLYTWIGIVCEGCADALAWRYPLAGQAPRPLLLLLEQGAVLKQTTRQDVLPRAGHAAAKPIVLAHRTIIIS